MECTVWDLLGKYSDHANGFRLKRGRVLWEYAHYNDGHKLVYISRVVVDGNSVRSVGRYVPYDTRVELVDYEDTQETQAITPPILEDAGV